MFDVYSVYTPFMCNVLKHGVNVVEDFQSRQIQRWASIRV